jgi:hypothetical protein
VGTWRDGLLVGDPRAAFVVNQALAYDLNLRIQDVAFQGSERLWVAGAAAHDPGDPPGVADRSPRGAARLTVGEGGVVTAFTHFVRTSEEPRDVTGLPSSDVRDVLPAADGGAWLACGTERYQLGVADHLDGDPAVVAGSQRPGGVARVDAADAVEVVAGPDVAPDARALAALPDGRLLVLDAREGALALDADGLAGAPPAALAGLPAGTPRAAWADADGGLAAGTDGGAVVVEGTARAVLDDIGTAWVFARRAAGVVLVGSDAGLVWAVGADATAPTEPAPGEAARPPFRPVVDPGPDPDPECLRAGSSCDIQDDRCCAGLTCVWAGFAPVCQ